MKKTSLSITLASLITGLAFCGQLAAAPTETHDETTSSHRGIIGLSSGLAIGAVVAGPIGAMVAGITGVLIAEDADNKEEKDLLISHLEQRQQELDALLSRYQTLLAKSELYEAENELYKEALVKQESNVELMPLESNIQFTSASYQLLPHYKDSLGKLAEQLRQQPQLKITLQGYADRRGESDYNQGLSEQRAQSVRAFLIANGVQENQIETVSYGEEQPIVQSQNWENDFFDRRVLLRVYNPDRVMTAAQ